MLLILNPRMADLNNEELIGAEDIIEKDGLVLMKATFIRNSVTVIGTAVGIKYILGNIE